MNTIIQKLGTNWHLMRIMRLGIGIMLLGAGVSSKDLAMGLFSIFFLYQAITDTGCCGSRGCSTPPPRMKKSTGDDKEIVYEEIK